MRRPQFTECSEARPVRHLARSVIDILKAAMKGEMNQRSQQVVGGPTTGPLHRLVLLLGRPCQSSPRTWHNPTVNRVSNVHPAAYAGTGHKIAS